MRVLIIGGTGGIGGYIAAKLAARGDDVTISSRNAPPAGLPISDLPFIPGSYVDDSIGVDDLRGFDAMIFAAANDVRQAPQGMSAEEEEAFYRRMNDVGVPRFFERARAAGIGRTAYIGSFYPQARPDLIEGNIYIRSRDTTDRAVRALAAPDFHVVSLNAPWIVGSMPGRENRLYSALVRWARGEMPAIPPFAIPGGVNFMSIHALADAVLGGLERGENGRGYLVGGENLWFREFFGLFFEAVGRPTALEERDQEHPLFPDAALPAGRSGTIFYEPEGVTELGYDPTDLRRTVQEIAAATA